MRSPVVSGSEFGIAGLGGGKVVGKKHNGNGKGDVTKLGSVN